MQIGFGESGAFTQRRKPKSVRGREWYSKVTSPLKRSGGDQGCSRRSGGDIRALFHLAVLATYFCETWARHPVVLIFARCAGGGSRHHVCYLLGSGQPHFQKTAWLKFLVLIGRAASAYQGRTTAPEDRKTWPMLR
jgi:hypothetical protein